MVEQYNKLYVIIENKLFAKRVKMLDKKEIGKKIWELFSKNYTYGQIAKELKISKSVVSNVINYTLPTHTWVDEDIKKLKQKYEQEIQKLKKELKEKEEEYKDLEYEKDSFIIVTLITIIIYIITTTIILYFVKIDFYYFYHNFLHVLRFVGYSISVIVSVFIIAYIIKVN